MKSSRARQYTGIECPICGKFLDFSAGGLTGVFAIKCLYCKGEIKLHEQTESITNPWWDRPMITVEERR